MAAINFPDVTSLNDGYTTTLNGVFYTLHKTSNTVFWWSASQADNPDNRYVNVSGDNMTGALGGVTTFRSANLTDGSTTKTMTEVLADPPSSNGYTAMVQFNGRDTPLSVQRQEGVTSVTDNGQGRYTVNFTSAFANTNYAYQFTTGFPNDANNCSNIMNNFKEVGSARFASKNPQENRDLDTGINCAMFWT